MVLTYFICLTVPIIRHAVDAFVIFCRSFAVLELMASSTQGACFLSLTIWVSVIELATFETSFRGKVVVDVAD